MRTRTLTTATAVLLLAACSSPEPSVAPTTTEVAEATTTTAAVTTEPTTEPPSPAAPPEQCKEEGHVGPVWEAIRDADLPDTAMISNVEEFPPGPDAEDQDSTVVQVTVCTHPINRDETREIASTIAAAAESYDGPGIYRMDVELLVENGPHLAEGRHVFVEDYGSIVWDRPAGETARFWTEV